MSEYEIGSEWKDAGRYTVCAIVDGRIYAVLYWSEGFAAQSSTIGEDALTSSGAGWFLVFVDDPDPHVKISGGGVQAVRREMLNDELAHATRSAMGVARRFIRKRLGVE